jgi:hypothetical protein
MAWRLSGSNGTPYNISFIAHNPSLHLIKPGERDRPSTINRSKVRSRFLISPSIDAFISAIAVGGEVSSLIWLLVGLVCLHLVLSPHRAAPSWTEGTPLFSFHSLIGLDWSLNFVPLLYGPAFSIVPGVGRSRQCPFFLFNIIIQHGRIFHIRP